MLYVWVSETLPLEKASKSCQLHERWIVCRSSRQLLLMSAECLHSRGEAWKKKKKKTQNRRKINREGENTPCIHFFTHSSMLLSSFCPHTLLLHTDNITRTENDLLNMLFVLPCLSPKLSSAPSKPKLFTDLFDHSNCHLFWNVHHIFASTVGWIIGVERLHIQNTNSNTSNRHKNWIYWFTSKDVICVLGNWTQNNCSE